MNTTQRLKGQSQKELTRCFICLCLLILAIYFGPAFAVSSGIDIALTPQQLAAMRIASAEAEKKLNSIEGYSVRITEDGDYFQIVFVYGDPLRSVRGTITRGRPTVEVSVRKRDGAMIESRFSR